MNESGAKKLHWNVLTHFVYVPDHIIHPDRFDHWGSHAQLVRYGHTFRDDCDGFALTCAELLLMKEADPGDVKIIFCQVETGEHHLVTSWQHWILDNRQRTIKYWDDLPYRWISSMRLNEKGVWRKMS